ncbi:MAG: TlpA family protein disulfide reductase [Acidimicrobiales bacterium]
MDRVLILVVLGVMAVGVSLALQRRRPEPPSAPSYRAPRQLDRDDFAEPETPLLVAVFTSATCNSCASAWSTVGEVADGLAGVVMQRIEIQDDPRGLHERYKIDGVPSTLVADAEGVVHESFFGPFEAEKLATALAEREQQG